MALATLDRTPPPFFRQGPSALTKLSLCAALALFLMVADTRMRLTQPLRAVAATVLQPLQRALLVPVDAWFGARDYLMGLQGALDAAEVARRQLALQSERAIRAEQLLRENTQLRALLELRPNLTVRSQAAQILYEASDPYSRKVVIDRGTTHGITAGSPVIDQAGVLGQVTRVYLMSSEVTLLTDKDAAIPVLNTRTLTRSAAFGGVMPVGASMEMRFMAGNADIKVGDTLTTSGVDGVYPPGLPVASVVSVDRKLDSGFARILLRPSALSDGVRHVLVLEPIGLQMPERPAPPPEAARLGARPAVKPGAKAAAKSTAAAVAPAVAASAVKPPTNPVAKPPGTAAATPAVKAPAAPAAVRTPVPAAVPHKAASRPAAKPAIKPAITPAVHRPALSGRVHGRADG